VDPGEFAGAVVFVRQTKGMVPKGEPDEPAWIAEAYEKR
jgi:hypothetical protein